MKLLDIVFNALYCVMYFLADCFEVLYTLYDNGGLTNIFLVCGLFLAVLLAIKNLFEMFL